VVSVAPVDEPDYLRGRVTRVSVFMNVFNVHVNYHPMDGVVEYRQYRPGRFVNATLDKASMDNEQMSLGVQRGGRRLMVRQIAGLIARRIVTDPEVGDAVAQGSRLGLIRFGSRVDTFLPDNAAPRVRVGDRTVGGVTVIGAWVR
jgi:phosphatidylserine decarboxylase